MPPEAVKGEPLVREAVQPRHGQVNERGIIQQPSDREQAAVGVDRLLGGLLRLARREPGRGAEQVLFDGLRRVGVVQQPARLGQRGVVAQQGVSNHEVQGHVARPGPVPLARLIAPAVGRRRGGRLEDSRRAGLVEVLGVIRVNLRKTQQEHARQPRQGGPLRAAGRLPRAHRRVQGGLGEELPRLVITLRQQVNPFVGIGLLRRVEDLIRVGVHDARPDLDRLRAGRFRGTAVLFFRVLVLGLVVLVLGLVVLVSLLGAVSFGKTAGQCRQVRRSGCSTDQARGLSVSAAPQDGQRQ